MRRVLEIGDWDRGSRQAMGIGNRDMSSVRPIGMGNPVSNSPESYCSESNSP